MGIIGQHIEHSLSPLIHNFSAERLGVPVAYCPFEPSVDDFETFLRLMWRLGAVGFNVTMPFKEYAAKLVSSNCSSINTIFRGEDGWQGVSTDGPGFEKALSDLGAHLGNFSSINLLGNGGVVTALVEHLAREFDSSPLVNIFRRRDDKDSFLRGLYKEGRIQFFDLSSVEVVRCLKSDPQSLLVQATSAPNRGDNLARLANTLDGFQGFFVDLTYGAHSALLESAEARGIPSQGGLSMLIEQARISQTFWWGKAVSHIDLSDYLASVHRC